MNGAPDGQGLPEAPGTLFSNSGEQFYDGDATGGRLSEKSRVILWGLGVVRWILGAFFSTFFILSVLVVGWTTRAAQREVLRTWWRRSPIRRQTRNFADFAAADPATRDHAAWPTWFAGSRSANSASAGRTRRWLRRALGGVVLNARLGLQVLANTWVLTLPGCLMWAVAWYAGWQNSFNKGYEHAWFGPTVFILGMVLFSAAMAYVPLAQARQASTGDWRRFYDFRIVWRLVRRRWLSSLALALVWAGACSLVLLVKLMPQLAQYAPNLTDRPMAEMAAVSQRFFGVMAMGLFPLFVGLRLLAARVYAEALRSGFQSGALTEDDLGEAEWQALRRLELLTPVPVPERGRWVRLAAWLATRTGRLAAGAAVFLIWFAFSFLAMVSEFAAITDFGRGWWNQPMVQLPWFDYTPARLRQGEAVDSIPSKNAARIPKDRASAEGP
ncbi:MAG: hypothetical protein JNL10_06020 [Verrucomicrobiales bacterium]|nr:hypothetical protein [Verrucomicrobiales bacterium]